MDISVHVKDTNETKILALKAQYSHSRYRCGSSP